MIARSSGGGRAVSTGSGPKEGLLSEESGRLPRLGARIIRRLGQGPYGKRVLIGLRRDLSVPFPAPAAKVPISLRPLRSEDIPALFPPTDGAAAERERADVRWRLRMVEQGALRSRCFVAVDERTGRPCHIQWLTDGYDEAIRIAAALPALSLDEALMENAYTPSTYRGMGIMSAVTARIADCAASSSLRYAVALVDRRNAASLRGAQRAGFLAWQVETRRQFGFGLFRRVRYEPVSAGLAKPYEGLVEATG